MPSGGIAVTASSVHTVIAQVLASSKDENLENGVGKLHNILEKRPSQPSRPNRQEDHDEDSEDEMDLLEEDSDAHSSVLDHQIISRQASHDATKIPVVIITKDFRASVHQDMNRLDLLEECRRRIDTVASMVPYPHTTKPRIDSETLQGAPQAFLSKLIPAAHRLAWRGGGGGGRGGGAAATSPLRARPVPRRGGGASARLRSSYFQTLYADIQSRHHM